MPKFDPFQADVNTRWASGDMNSYSGNVKLAGFDTTNAGLPEKIMNSQRGLASGAGLGYVPTSSGTSTASFMNPIGMVAESIKNAQMQSLDLINASKDAEYAALMREEANKPGIHAGLHAEMKGSAYTMQKDAITAGARLGQTVGGIPGAVVGALIGSDIGNSKVDLNTAFTSAGKINPQDESTVASMSAAPQQVQDNESSNGTTS